MLPREKRQVASGPSLRRVKLCFDFTASCVPSRLGVRAARGPVQGSKAD